ncbi:hypothetical protein BT67DRAFT_101892 [Trichocladium antarcticum]|uniref:Uncharacterized protein n=1 Tax=Trichocladium antarcticum TaxID=1450529 RepID=A0AAN6UR21_9PEZI|nr:hypothetical protein BT67DRAFT_101892 [Trichocladium antarcticum]
MVALDRAVTEDLARTWPVPRAPETGCGRDVGVPEEVVGLTAGAVPDVAERVDTDGCRIEAARARRLVGGGASGPELSLPRWRIEAARVRRLVGAGGSGPALSLSRRRVDDEVTREKTPEIGRAVLVVLPVTVALLDGRVALAGGAGTCPLEGILLGETWRASPPALALALALVLFVVSDKTLGLRRERARDSALPDDDDIPKAASAGVVLCVDEYGNAEKHQVLFACCWQGAFVVGLI